MINQPTDNDGADDDGEGAVQPQQETATTIANAGAHSEDESSQTSFHSALSDEHDSIDDESEEEEIEVRRKIPPAAPPVITGSQTIQPQIRAVMGGGAGWLKARHPSMEGLRHKREWHICLLRR